MKKRTLLVVTASVAAMITGCESLDKGALAGAGLASASAGKGGNKAEAAVAAGAVGIGAANAIASNADTTQTRTVNRENANVAPQRSIAVADRGMARGDSTTTAPSIQKQSKPEYTIEQYKQAFEKMPAEKVADAIMKAAKHETAHNPDSMIKALTWRNGATVLQIMKDDPRTFDSGYFMKIRSAYFKSLDAIQDQQTLRDAIACLPPKPKARKYLDDYFGDNRSLYTLIDKISDPTVADYMLDQNIYLGEDVQRLVGKLSKERKEALFAAAMQRAENRKDRVVIEGYYIGMSYLDAIIIRNHQGFDGGDELVRFFSDSSDWENLLLPSEAGVTFIQFENKAWSRFMDCEDSEALYQCIHQYVKKLPGKAHPMLLEYMQLVSHERREGRFYYIYASTKLGTKISFDERLGSIALLKY